MKTVGAYLLMGTALLACPCHLVFLLPAVLGLLGGTALGTALGANTGWVITAATVYFVGALAGGLYLLNRRAKHEENPKPSPVGATPKLRAPSRSRGMARRGR
ncbi:MAG: hypothetical protein M3R38_20160 [Actinomycetota bacterium]|nr:hypothetical protein [Actinomycetota bacterium]